jgi:hypothetical protein
MGRLVLGGLLGVMLALTGFAAYSTFGTCEQTIVDPAAVASDSGCCSQKAATCPTETAATDETPACCKDKAKNCETKGEAGTCCQNPSKAEAITGKKTEPKNEDAPK